MSSTAKKFWAKPRRLFVPAWKVSLNVAKQISTQLILSQPNFQLTQSLTDKTLASASLNKEDALKLLELILITIEAKRRDKLQSIQLDINIGEPELWAIPSLNKNEGWEIVAQTK